MLADMYMTSRRFVTIKSLLIRWAISQVFLVIIGIAVTCGARGGDMSAATFHAKNQQPYLACTSAPVFLEG